METVTPVTKKDAEKVGCILKQHPRVLGLELFGSVAREGSGADLDLIILSLDVYAEHFIVETKRCIEDARIANSWLQAIEEFARESEFSPREEAAIAVLGSDFISLLREAKRQLPPIRGRSPLDLYLLPLAWKENISSLEVRFPQGHPTFWHNILRDVRAL